MTTTWRQFMASQFTDSPGMAFRPSDSTNLFAYLVADASAPTYPSYYTSFTQPLQESENHMYYAPFIESDKVDPNVKLRVKNFIVAVSNNQRAGWPGYGFSLWTPSGVPILVKAGSHWYKYDSEIHLGHDPNQPAPLWVPGVMSSLALVFGLREDAAVSDAIITMATRMVANIFQPLLQNSTAQFADSGPVERIAINVTTRLMVAEHKSATGEPSVWRTMSGEEIEVPEEDPEWVSIAF